MDQCDLETYQVQLSQVDLTLSADPDNTELASELKEHIELTRTAQTQAAAPKSESDECLAKYSGDGNWYSPARITFVGGAADNRVFSIVFRSYNTTKLSKAGGIKALPTSYSAAGAGPYGGAGKRKRKLSKEEVGERERNNRNNGKKNKKQASWQKFVKKSEEKGLHIAGMSGTSIFKTPENAWKRSELGVTGSEKGITENAPRPKNKFARDGSAS
ncbi:hypothetical protein DFH11DRAFT_1818368 [Phellopilus nigrolimitatus]|nr:hypothetical protein DFH11DRAFT_1818368 [Phellopilus nigrolimitatus]